MKQTQLFMSREWRDGESAVILGYSRNERGTAHNYVARLKPDQYFQIARWATT